MLARLRSALPRVLADVLANVPQAGDPRAESLVHHPVWMWALGALLVLAVLGAAAWLLWHRRARRALRRVVRRVERRPGRPRYPVVLAHGLFGFDEIAIGGVRHAYFRGVPARLEKSGCVVSLARVTRSGPIAVRAGELTRFIQALEEPRVNIVAHSMGGLDARYAIAKLGLGDRVASLTTVGTPHRGTPLADIGIRLGVGRALQSLGVRLDALEDLTPRRMESFNAAVENTRGIAYGSVVGVARRKREMNPLLVPGHLYLNVRAGENDGMVPAVSQEWGEVLHRIEADHWAQIGWSRHFDAVEFYALLLRELRGRGF